MLKRYMSPVTGHLLLVIAIFILPFLNGVMSFNILGITGAKPSNICMLLLIILLFLTRTRYPIVFGNTRLKVMTFYCIYIFVFTVLFARAFNNIDLFAVRYANDFYQYLFSSFGFILSYWLVPVLHTMTFVYVVFKLSTRDEVSFVLKAVTLSFTLAAVLIVYSVYFAEPMTNRHGINAALLDVFNAHYNTVGTFFVITVPIALALAFEQRRIWLIPFAIMIVAMFMLKSRGALLGAAAATALFLVVSGIFSLRNAVYLALAGAIIYLAWEPLMSMFDLQKLSGSTRVDSSNLDDVSSGRIDGMWIPLARESFSNAASFFLGYGLLGVIATDAYVNEYHFYQATHAHNGYLNLAIDAGWIVMVSFVLTMLYYIYRGIRSFQFDKSNKLLLGCVVAVFGYMVSCLTGRFFTPVHDNYLLFLVIGCAICLSLRTRDA